MFMIKTIQQFFIQTFSKQSVSFKSKSTDRQLSGQHLCSTFNVAELFWVLNDRALIRIISPDKRIPFNAQCFGLNTTLNFAKNL